MRQEIRNIRAGQKFIVIGMSMDGFDIGCIVEAMDNINNVEERCGVFRYIGGRTENYAYKDCILIQYKSDLKRFKGKIK